MIAARRPRWLRLATLISQAGNVILFDGCEDETISGRAWREGEACPVWYRRRKFIDRLFWFDYDHCRKSHEVDLENAARFFALTKAYGEDVCQD